MQLTRSPPPAPTFSQPTRALGIYLSLSAATTQGTRTCNSCNGRSTIETTAQNTFARYYRGGGRGRGGRDEVYGGRDRDRFSFSNWRYGERYDGHNNGKNRRDDYARNCEVLGGDGRCIPLQLR